VLAHNRGVKDIRRIRNFLDLRQADVSAAVGITVARISAAENHRIRLSPDEQCALEEFLRARLRVVLGTEELPE
jgi:transcriptional regulator with XRE-family HTH domain